MGDRQGIMYSRGVYSQVWETDVHRDVKPISKGLVTHADYGIWEVSELRVERSKKGRHSLWPIFRL